MARHGGQMHGMHRKGPFNKLDLTPEQRQQIGKMMGDQWHGRSEMVQKYLAKLSPADQKAMQDEMAAKHTRNPGRHPRRADT